MNEVFIHILSNKKKVVEIIDIHKFLDLRADIPIIDVRSEKEFAQAHIPNAINLPIFTNKVREKVGISYKKEGRRNATIFALELIGDKFADFARKAISYSKSNKLLVYCWRGGMRSSSMSWLFSLVGIDVYLLEGGYKSYRRLAQETFAQATNYTVVGGMTGSGKTQILKELRLQNEQVIDLEGLANHKGSAFGMLGQDAQSTTEQFENNLFEILRTFDASKRIWIEDESRSIGRICIPDEVFRQMRAAPVVNVNIPADVRVKFLLEEYGFFPVDDLKNSVSKIQKRLGGAKAKQAIEALDNQNVDKAIEIVLEYYDKTYTFGLSKREGNIRTINFDNANHKEHAEKLIKFVENKI